MSGNDDQDLEVGNSSVRFVCGNDQGEPLASGYFYRFRVYEPCGSANHSTPLEIDAASGDNGIDYDIDLSGDYAAQCAVCSGSGTSATCDWEPYTPTTCS